MAQIVVNEISQNYTYNIGTNSFCTVALPITAQWGPAYQNPTVAIGEDATAIDMLEQSAWHLFPATQSGLESFVSTFRGPATNYRLMQDYSYQMAMTLLTSGYDVLVHRLCDGVRASMTKHPIPNSIYSSNYFTVEAKHPGSFGNNLKVKLVRLTKGFGDHAKNYWNLIVYIVDASGVQSAVENVIFVFDISNSTDTLPHVSEVESVYVNITTDIPGDDVDFDISPSEYGFEAMLGTADSASGISATIGSDYSEDKGSTALAWTAAKDLATVRYTGTVVTDESGYSIEVGAGYPNSEDSVPQYLEAFGTTAPPSISLAEANAIMHMEWIYNAAFIVLNQLQDKLNYNPKRIIMPGWDDQDIRKITKSSDKVTITQVSPLHKKLMHTAYYSRCGTALIDIPKSEVRASVYVDSPTVEGYAQMLARTSVAGTGADAFLYSSHSALFAPWGSFKYVGGQKQYPASPSFLALLIQRAQILNQASQYEWALPTNRRHNLRLGKFEYAVPKHLLDIWQSTTGVGVNVLTAIPDLGTNLWGNSTLFEVPPATYQALANLSTRYLYNAVKDVVYKCGIQITFQYNNDQAYNKFYAGVSPLLDIMKQVGAIEDYYIRMAADINGLDQVNANTVVGKIYLIINGCVQDIIVDLIALPPGTDLNQFRS